MALVTNPTKGRNKQVFAAFLFGSLEKHFSP